MDDPAEIRLLSPRFAKPLGLLRACLVRAVTASGSEWKVGPATRVQTSTRSRSLLRSALLTIGLALVCPRLPAADAPPKVAVAAAANLIYALDALQREFARAAPEIKVTTTTGASGNLFAQVKNGAPFDIFLSADTEFPRAVVAAGLGDPTTLCTFATGRLVVWTTRTEVGVGDLAAAVRDPRVKRIALAQPRAAPYGRAAQAALEDAGVWSEIERKLVFGESISQTAQFVETGNADLGLVALSLVLSPQLAHKGTWHEVPAKLYSRVSLAHGAVLTTRGAANPAARRYLEFLRGPAGQAILRQFGYGPP
jgi:molybdate transport system substrate-binding protein